MDSGHSRMLCASTGTAMLLTIPCFGYLCPYWSKSIWSRSFFPCMDFSQVVYIIWTLKPVNDLRPANETAFLVFAAAFTLQETLVTGQFMTSKSSFKTQPFGICIGQLFTFYTNALTWFFLINMNKRRYGNLLVARAFPMRLSANDILRWSWIDVDLYESRLSRPGNHLAELHNHKYVWIE